MKKLTPLVACLGLVACQTRPSVEDPRTGRTPVGSFTGFIDTETGQFDIRPGDGTDRTRRGLSVLGVESDGVRGSGSPWTVELATVPGTTGPCAGALTFGGDVELNSFYPFPLTNIVAHVHTVIPPVGFDPQNADPSFMGLDPSLGLWVYSGSGAVRNWCYNTVGSGNFIIRGHVFADYDFQPTFTEIAPAPGSGLICTTNYSNSGRKIAINDRGQVFATMSCSGETYVVTSNDLGASFGPTVQAGIINPQEVAVQGGPDGMVYVLGIDGSNNVLFTSSDGGTSFAPPTNLATDGVDYGVSLAVDGNRIYAAYANAAGVVVRRNDNRGIGAWSPPTVLPMALQYFDVLVDQPTGDVWVATDSGDLRRSTDGGVTFGAPISPPLAPFMFSDWSIGNGRILVSGFGGDGYWIPLSAPNTSQAIAGLYPSPPLPPLGGIRAVAVNANGDGYVVSQLDPLGIIVQFIPAGSNSVASQQVWPSDGWVPGVIALPSNNGVAVVFSSAGGAGSVYEYTAIF